MVTITQQLKQTKKMGSGLMTTKTSSRTSRTRTEEDISVPKKNVKKSTRKATSKPKVSRNSSGSKTSNLQTESTSQISTQSVPFIIPQGFALQTLAKLQSITQQYAQQEQTKNINTIDETTKNLGILSRVAYNIEQSWSHTVLSIKRLKQRNMTHTALLISIITAGSMITVFGQTLTTLIRPDIVIQTLSQQYVRALGLSILIPYNEQDLPPVQIVVPEEDPVQQEIVQKNLALLAESNLPENRAMQAIINYYKAVNLQQFDLFPQYVEKTLLNGRVFRTYMTPQVFSRFLAALTPDGITITGVRILQTIDNNTMKIGYEARYTLKNNKKTYIEEREVDVAKVGNNFQITKMMCNTKGCSRMPFFNPARFNIQ